MMLILISEAISNSNAVIRQELRKRHFQMIDNIVGTVKKSMAAIAAYPKSVVTLLKCILEFTYVPDWRQSAAEECFSRALPISKWAFHTNLDWNTVNRAFKILKKDGVIKMNPQAEGSYAVNAESLTLLKSKFRNTSVKQLERKILKAVRMMVSRKEQKIVQKVALERKALEDAMRQSNPERYAKQKALGRFEWDEPRIGPGLVEEHPAPKDDALTCLCVPCFCSHPSVI